MENIEIKVYAKINEDLKIKGVYDDGYHKLDMTMASVDIFDRIYAKKTDNSKVYMDGVLQDSKNTAVRAVELLESAFGYPMYVEIIKGIPESAGLGGSSADASGVFFCYSKLFNIDLSSMHKLALEIGSDVVYMMYGGARKVSCRGEHTRSIPFEERLYVIAQKEIGASTKDVYKKHDEIDCDYDEFVNDLQPAAVELCPSIQENMLNLKVFSKNVFMTGSGSAVVAEFSNYEKAVECLDSISGYVFKKVCKTLPKGIEIIK